MLYLCKLLHILATSHLHLILKHLATNTPLIITLNVIYKNSDFTLILLPFYLRYHSSSSPYPLLTSYTYLHSLPSSKHSLHLPHPPPPATVLTFPSFSCTHTLLYTNPTHWRKTYWTKACLSLVHYTILKTLLPPTPSASYPYLSTPLSLLLYKAYKDYL